MDVLVEQFSMNHVTRRNKNHAAQICQATYFIVHGQNNNDDDGEEKMGFKKLHAGVGLS